MIKLIVQKNGKKVNERILDEHPVSLGSSSNSDIVLEAQNIAPEHAVISLLGDKILIEDQGSEAGTFMEDARISTAFLEEGVVVKIGPYSMHIEKAQPDKAQDGENAKESSDDRRPLNEDVKTEAYSQDVPERETERSPP